MKTLSLLAVALLSTMALLSTGCGEPEAAPAPAPTETPAASGSDTTAEPAGSSTSSTNQGGAAELTAVSFSVEGMT